MLNTKELPVSTQSKRPIATTLPFSLKSIPTPLSDVQQENIKLKRKLRHQQLRFAALHAENKVMRLHIRRSRQNHTIASKPIQQHDNFQRQTTGVLNTSKPKIALIIDSESWAFANIAKQLVKHLQHRFEFRIIPAAIIDNVVQVLLMTADCTLTHFFWRDFLNSASQKFAHHYSHDLGFASHQTFLNEYVHRRLITTSIYDHLFLTPTAINERSALFNNMISGYTVSSQRLMNLYRDIPNIPDPVGLT